MSPDLCTPDSVQYTLLQSDGKSYYIYNVIMYIYLGIYIYVYMYVCMAF